MRVYVIVPAAGIGTRMAISHPAGGLSPSGANANPAAPKQFLTIGGVPVLIHSLRAFLAVERVSSIYVAVRATEMERMKTHIADFQLNNGGLGEKVHVVEGGENRQDSVSRALAAVGRDFPSERGGANPDDVVLVHDAVRPLIDPATIDRTIDAIVKHGAAIVGLPAVDTIKQVERTANGALVTSTIPRERVVYAQTPQGALYPALKRAFDEAAADEFLGTDEASLLERAGVPVVVVAGSARNFKITQPGDLELAEFYLKRVE
jgi:2-C-methyl-D-erythritol 4-phosphate cytidylyltransferase